MSRPIIEHRPLAEWVKRPDAKGRMRDTLVTHYVPYVPLRTCDACGKVSTPKHIGYRYNRLAGWTRYKDEVVLANYLCIACNSKLLPYIKTAQEAAEIGVICRKMLYQLPKLFNALNEDENGR